MESKTKRCVSRILALVLAFALCLTLLGAAPGTASSGNGASDLYFSQYIEGTSYNKALEIYNGTGAAVDLSAYTVELHANGKVDADNRTALSGTLASGDVLVLYHSSSSATLISCAGDNAKTATVCNFNGGGGDYIVLLKNDVEIDVIGSKESQSANHQNYNLIRKATVTGPSAPYNADEWDFTPISDDSAAAYTNLGQPTSGGSGGTTVAAPKASPQAGSVTSGTQITLTCSTSGATIYYTLDGSDPTTSSTQYTGPITIEGGAGTTVTLKAVAVLDNVSSAVHTISYTIKAEAEMPIADGDQVVIYAPAYNKALSSTKTGFYNVGTDIQITDGVMTGYTAADVWTVVDNGDGTFSFQQNGQNIGMADEHASMDLGAEHDKWELIDLGSGLYNVKNTGRGNYMEWYDKYSNWSTYNSSSAATDGQFKLAFYKVEGDTPEPGPTSAELVENIAEGDIVVVYHPNSGNVMGTAVHEYNGDDELNGVSATVAENAMAVPSGAALLKVYQQDGHYVFKNENGYLYLDGDNVNFSAELGEYNYFGLESTSGGWYIKSVNAEVGGNAQYLEYFYDYFTCFGLQGGGDAYTFQFYKAGTFDPDTDPLPDEGETAGAPFAAGDDIVIYAPSNNMALSSTVKSQYYPVGVAVTVSDDEISGYGDTEIWTVGGAADGWTFATAEGTTLSMGGSYTSTYPGAGSNETWVLEEAETEGQFYIKNVGRGTYLWWDDEHDDWTTKSDQKTAVAFRIVERTDEPGEEVTGLEVLASPVSGAVVREGDTIELIAAKDATIYYTTDGSEPTSGSAVYTEPLTVGGAQVPEPTSGQPLVVKALAVMTGEDGTEQAGSVYTFTYKAPDTLDGYTLYFGQLHSHTDISDGTGSVEDAFEHASNVPGLDFLAVTDHSNSFGAGNSKTGEVAFDQIDLGKDMSSLSGEWASGHAAAEEITEEGTFVGIYGFEMTWSGGFGHINTFNTPRFSAAGGY